jgi:outer membrane lipoprotein SlyB
VQQSRIHPLVAAMAFAVLLLSAVGIAAVTGVLPAASSRSAASQVSVPEPALAQGAPSAAQVAACRSCGFIESIRTAEVQGDASGLGAVAGGLAGAVVGNQFGSGSGRTLMAIAGAAGGAYAGNAIEKNTKKRTVYRVRVRLDDGTSRTVTHAQPPRFAVGERVRIVNGSMLERA